MLQDILWPLTRAYNSCRNGKPKPRTQVGFESTARGRSITSFEMKRSVMRKRRHQGIIGQYWNQPLHEEVSRRIDVWNKCRVLEKFLEAEALGDRLWFVEAFCMFGSLMVSLAKEVNRPREGTTVFACFERW